MQDCFETGLTSFVVLNCDAETQKEFGLAGLIYEQVLPSALRSAI